MAPHLTGCELEQMRVWQSEGHRPMDIYLLLRAKRDLAGIPPVGLTAVRKVLKGATHQTGCVETRGRKRKLSDRALRAIDAKRRQLIKKVDGRREVTWREVMRKARVCPVHPTTAKRALAAAGINIAARAPRQKPQRKGEHLEERMEVCRRWRYLPSDYFFRKVSFIIDNKRWPVPMTEDARAHLQKLKVRFHLRTRSEGLAPGFTKPNAKKHQRNTGGSVAVCAGICGDRVVMWKYIDGPWGESAADSLYRHDINRVLTRYAGSASGATIVEDNDPSGYKSGKAIQAKKDLGIRVMALPRYSPDLNPLDYFLWADIDRRMNLSAPRGRESKEAFKRRLRTTAFATPRALVRRAVLQMKQRVAAVYAAEGGDITLD